MHPCPLASPASGTGPQPPCFVADLNLAPSRAGGPRAPSRRHHPSKWADLIQPQWMTPNVTLQSLMTWMVARGKRQPARQRPGPRCPPRGRGSLGEKTMAVQGGCHSPWPRPLPANRGLGPSPRDRPWGQWASLYQPLHLGSLRLPTCRMGAETTALHRDWSQGPESPQVKYMGSGLLPPPPSGGLWTRLHYSISLCLSFPSLNRCSGQRPAWRNRGSRAGRTSAHGATCSCFFYNQKTQSGEGVGKAGQEDENRKEAGGRGMEGRGPNRPSLPRPQLWGQPGGPQGLGGHFTPARGTEPALLLPTSSGRTPICHLPLCDSVFCLLADGRGAWALPAQCGSV